MDWFFISFLNVSENKCLGCVNLQASSPDEALEKTRTLEINPGGEAKVFTTVEAEEAMEPDRLYSREEMLELGYSF